MAKDLAQEARELGIEPASYNLEDEDQKKALQERVDGRKAEIKAVEGKQPALKEDGSEDQPRVAKGVMSKEDTKTKPVEPTK